MDDNALAHHGILGQKWGVRRYQNKDGSLTPAGKKKAAKMKADYTELTGKQLRRSPTKTSTTSKSKANSTSKEESLETKTRKLQEERNYLQTQRDVLQLKKQISEMTPKEVNKGKQFAQKYGPKLAEKAWNDLGKPTVQKYIDKQLGLTKTESKSDKLARMARDAKNAYEIDNYKYKREHIGEESKKKKKKVEHSACTVRPPKYSLLPDIAK